MNNKRYDDSWEEYYQKKGEELTGLICHLALTEFSSFDGLLREYTGKPASFKESVAQHSYGNFILEVPVGTNQVKCIHSCFAFGELGGGGTPVDVVRILGSRRSPPFKTININHAIKPFSEPRSTRTSEARGDECGIYGLRERGGF
jgi:hypothetical protein